VGKKKEPLPDLPTGKLRREGGKGARGREKRENRA